MRLFICKRKLLPLPPGKCILMHRNNEKMEDIQMDILHAPVFDGRPTDTAKRLEKELRTYDLLDSLQIPYKRIDHEALPTIEACHDVDTRLGIHICKNLFLCNTQKTNFYLLMLTGEKKFRTKLVSKQLGIARLSFAPEEYMEQLLDLTPGSVSVLGLMNDKDLKVQLLVDEDLLKQTYIGCHPCINTSSLRIAVNDLIEKFLPAVKHTPTFLSLPEPDALPNL